jgi:hypothetical protein
MRLPKQWHAVGNMQLCAAPVEDVQVRVVVGVGVRLGSDQLLEVLHQLPTAPLTITMVLARNRPPCAACRGPCTRGACVPALLRCATAAACQLQEQRAAPHVHLVCIHGSMNGAPPASCCRRRRGGPRPAPAAAPAPTGTCLPCTGRPPGRPATAGRCRSCPSPQMLSRSSRPTHDTFRSAAQHEQSLPMNKALLASASAFGHTSTHTHSSDTSLNSTNGMGCVMPTHRAPGQHGGHPLVICNPVI